eukprot:1061121-Karenia_brevis.AAC.1
MHDTVLLLIVVWWVVVLLGVEVVVGQLLLGVRLLRLVAVAAGLLVAPWLLCGDAVAVVFR